MKTVSSGSITTKPNPNLRNVAGKDDVDFVRANRLQNRLKSFKQWTAKKSYMQLAIAGFSYTGFEDRVECEDCKKRILKWRSDDDPLEVHYRLSPNCPFLTELGFRTDQQIPKYRKFANYTSRLKSMQNVPEEYIQRLPSFEELARSGFFYQGTLDRMCCFFCALILRDWEPDSIPNDVHKQYSKNCRFIDMIVENQGSSTDQRERQGGKQLQTGTTTLTRKSELKAPDHLVNWFANNALQQATSHMKHSQQPSLNIKHRPIGRFSCQSSLREVSKRNGINHVEQSEIYDTVDGTHDKKSNSDHLTSLPSLVDREGEQTTDPVTTEPQGASASLPVTAIEEAVLEMGYRLEDIVKVENERREQGQGEFEDAESLCLAVMDLVENISKHSQES